jgi:hypothetical protein
MALPEDVRQGPVCDGEIAENSYQPEAALILLTFIYQEMECLFFPFPFFSVAWVGGYKNGQMVVKQVCQSIGNRISSDCCMLILFWGSS